MLFYILHIAMWNTYLCFFLLIRSYILDGRLRLVEWRLCRHTFRFSFEEEENGITKWLSFIMSKRHNKVWILNCGWAPPELPNRPYPGPNKLRTRKCLHWSKLTILRVLVNFGTVSLPTLVKKPWSKLQPVYNLKKYENLSREKEVAVL